MEESGCQLEALASLARASASLTKNFIYTAPTGGGKTLVADLLAWHHCLAGCKVFLRSVQIVAMSATFACIERLAQWLDAEFFWLRSGVAVHHSGISMAERMLVEAEFMKGNIRCLFCTSTLAAGVNLPAHRISRP
uniref:Uncharacterized protein LOC113799033 n=1 Tax=Dermatophagoides pteronyssinus TaxID=6956 RepID=A0A6P6YJI7_DERPT|nr:uncharacterized protein LOC113799033 [Dermatophagoides pteronyssinus]